MITISRQSAVKTQMPALAQCLFNIDPTSTSLRRAARIYFHQHSTSVLRFVGKHIKKVRPSSITHKFGKPSRRQSLYVQSFNSNQSVLIDNLSRFSVMKVAPLVTNITVKALERQRRFSPAIRSFLSARNLTLQASELSLRDLIPSWIVNSRAVAQRGERRQSDIYADSRGTERQRFRLIRDCKNSKPSICLSFYCESFNLSCERSCQADLNHSDFRQSQLTALQRISDLSERKTVVSTYGAKARIAAFFSTLYSPKKRPERQIDALQNILQHVCIYRSYVVSVLFNNSQLQGLIVVGNEFAINLPRVTSFLKCGVIQFSAQSKRAIENGLLSFSWVNPVTEGLDHRDIIYQNI